MTAATPVLAVDGEAVELASFLDANDGSWLEGEREEILALAVGEETTIGGGAFAEIVVRRIR